MKKLIIYIFLCLLACTKTQAQSFYGTKEWGLVSGGSLYFGDLNDRYGFQEIYPALGSFFRLHFNPYISLRASVLQSKVGYSDAYSSNIYNKTRNLSFKSNITEFAVQGEFNFFRFYTGDERYRFTPYLTGGMGIFFYNPYANIDGRDYDLRPLGTEGQNLDMYADRRYKNYAFSFPIGLGVKYWVFPGMNVGLEIVNRLTSTDYLDDVSSRYVGADKFPNDPENPNPAFLLQDRSIEVSSDPLGRINKQRGNGNTNDQYMMLLFHFTFQFKTYSCPQQMTQDYSTY